MPEESYHDKGEFSRLKVLEIINDKFIISSNVEDFIQDEFYLNSFIEFDIFRSEEHNV